MPDPSASVPACYVILLNWNGWADTLACIDSLFALPDPNLHLVVVDNASTDGSADKLHAGLLDRTAGFSTFEKASEGKLPAIITVGTGTKSVVLLLNRANHGFAGGTNRGIAHALLSHPGDQAHLWLLNNDTLVHPDALSELRSASLHFEDRAIVGSKLLFADDPTLVQSVGGRYNRLFASTSLKGLHDRDDRWQGTFETSIDYVMGASLFVPLTFARQVGLMEESYFLYYEEMDWILRGRKFGFHPVTALRSRVYHKVGRSIGSNPDGGKRSLLADFYLMRNRLLFTERFYPKFRATVMLGVCASAALRLRRGQPAHARQIGRVLLAALRGDLHTLPFSPNDSP